MNKSLFFNTLFVLFLCISISVIAYSCGETKNNNKIVLKTFEVENGNWAYTIEVNGKAFINQVIIPAVGGNKPFVSKEDALKTGNLMLEKMKKEEGFPSLSIDEVKGLNLTGL